MVTAILIPIICIYFYWISKKEWKQNEKKWESLSEIHEEAIIEGEITQLQKSKKRFYYNKYVEVLEILLQTETKSIFVKRITPFTTKNEAILFSVGDHVRLFGNWEVNEFRFLRYDILPKKDTTFLKK